MNLGGRVKREREALGWGQQQLAEKVPGLSQQNLGALEMRDSRTSEYAVGLADALGVSLRWLLGGTGRKDELDWPFSRVARARWDACDDTDRGYVQAAMNKALDECEAQRRPVIRTGRDLKDFAEAELSTSPPLPEKQTPPSKNLDDASNPRVRAPAK